ncbi:MAG: holo-[acyl-carrier-protein] synthase [Opitutaceae bacterium]|jgi:holo-[acyl-carrier protein] synthase|nr:holo-[acyl-carrier-protein] synthase [Opitutaceae bacterium]NBR58120.1 holo-[acyl-carrier-protein] synthase [Opitutaceae bacterium]
MNITLPPGGTLIGLGCDLIEVERIQAILAKHGERFLKRIFTEEEQAYCNTLKYSHKHYAARWAAKEAVSKCFTTGIGEHLDWTSISVYHGARKEPLVRLDAKAAALLQAVGATHVWLTLSHTESHAMAVAALVSHR